MKYIVVLALLACAFGTATAAGGRRAGENSTTTRTPRGSVDDRKTPDNGDDSTQRGLTGIARRCERMQASLGLKCSGLGAATSECSTIMARFGRSRCSSARMQTLMTGENPVCNGLALQAAIITRGTVVLIPNLCPGGVIDIILVTELEFRNDVILVCAGASGDCTVRGGNTVRVLEVFSGVEASIINVDIKDGFVNGNGGCIALERGGIDTELYLTSLTVGGCEAFGASIDGGGVFVSRVSANNLVYATDVNFDNNLARDIEGGKGGAIYLNGGGNEQSTKGNFFFMNGGRFFNNQCQSVAGLPCLGGAIFSGRDTDVEINNVNFFANSATTKGGAINTFPGALTSFDPNVGLTAFLILANCNFEFNEAPEGAAIYAAKLINAPLDDLEVDMFDLQFNGPLPPNGEVNLCLYDSCNSQGGPGATAEGSAQRSAKASAPVEPRGSRIAGRGD